MCKCKGRVEKFREPYLRSQVAEGHEKLVAENQNLGPEGHVKSLVNGIILYVALPDRNQVLFRHIF